MQKSGVFKFEAHTDFPIFAIIGEIELGYIGAVLALLMVLRRRAMSIGRKALRLTTVFPDF